MIGSLILADNGGFWAPIAKPLAAVLAYFYSLVPNYGIAIVLLTVAMMVVLTPLTIKQTRSMLVMQKLQPEMKKLQDMHKNDRQALNEAVMALYKEHNASPLGGCLPMLLPFPLFIALLKVLEGLSHLNTTVVNGAKVTTSVPKYLTVHTRMAQDIVKAHGDLDSFGMNLAKSARNVGGGFAHTLPYFVLLLIMVGTQFYQQYQLTSKNPAVSSQPGQAMMMKFIPLFFGIISLTFPAGVVLYWTVSNVIRIGQQWALYRYDPKVKALVTKDVKEIEAKTREIDARDNKPAVRQSLRERLSSAMDTGTDRKGQGGKDAAKPTGSAPSGKGGAAGRGGRTPPGKATTGTPNAAKQRPGAVPPKGAGTQKPGVAKAGASKAGGSKGGPPKPGISKPASAKPGAPRAGGSGAKPGPGAAKPGVGGVGGGAAKAGAARAGAPKPGIPRPAPKPGVPRSGAPKPGMQKSGAPKPSVPRSGAPSAGSPATADPVTSRGATPGSSRSDGPTNGSAGPSKTATPGGTDPAAPPTPAGATSPVSGLTGPSDPTNGSTSGGGSNGGGGNTPPLAATRDAENPEGNDSVPATGNDGADATEPNGNGSPVKGRTGGGSARNVSSRNRRRGR